MFPVTVGNVVQVQFHSFSLNCFDKQTLIWFRANFFLFAEVLFMHTYADKLFIFITNPEMQREPIFSSYTAE